LILPLIPAAPRLSLAMPACLAAGALSVLAFAPFGYWPIQIATMSLLFWLSVRQVRVRDSALLASAYGTGWFGAAIWWLYVSMHDYGGLPGWMAALAVVLLAVFLSGFPALALSGEAWFRLRRGVRQDVSLLLVLPALWMLSEWLRGWVLTGFPWAATGYAHTDSPLAGYAPLLGVYGLGWLAALLAAWLAQRLASGLTTILPRLPQRRLLVLAVVVLASGLLLQQIDWTHPHGKPISVRLLQGNVPQEMKFDPSQIRDSLNLYRDMITASPADLVATPETALPVLLQGLPVDFVQSLVGYTSATGSAVLFGVPAADSTQHYANSVIGLGPHAPPGSAYRYDKHHLVPFGEFVPPGARWFIDMMHIPLGDFSKGGVAQPPFAVRDQQVMPNICYEDLFGEEIAATIRHAVLAGRPQPTILLNVSNIAWFGDTIALPQHLQISRMRALEVRRPMLRATNTGVTAVISPHGKVLDQLKPYTRGMLSATVQGQSGWTPYSLYGNWLVVVLAMAVLAAVYWRTRRRTAKNDALKA
jgi:apolipoprotein N-acyltransferase